MDGKQFHYVAQAGLEPLVFLLQPLECWDYRCESPHMEEAGTSEENCPFVICVWGKVELLSAAAHAVTPSTRKQLPL